MFHLATGWQFWADISEFQPPVDKTYPYATLAYRLDTGWRIDNHAKANHATSEKMKSIGARIGYVVFIPGQTKAILQRLKNNFGNGDPGIAIMDDMESGKDFAGPGNHSIEANDFHDELAAWTNNDMNRQLGYANAYDWASLWKVRPAGMKRVLADYEATIKSGYWAQQYVGGGNTPVPSGFPRACRPFGSWVDLNAKKTTVPAMLDELGLDWLSMATQAQVKALVAAELKANNKTLINDLLAAQIKSHDGKVHGQVGHFISETYEMVATVPGVKKAN